MSPIRFHKFQVVPIWHEGNFTLNSGIDGQANWLGRSLFLLKNRFLVLVLPNINRSGYNFAHTYCCMWADLDCDRRLGGSRPNQNDYVFNTCNAP